MQTRLTDGDYIVRVVHLPGCIGGAVRLSPDGFANVYINDCLSPAEQRKVLKHELNHIARGDFDNCLSIEEVEADA